ncbi:hypothetical protein B0684_05105 [Thioalkalivibrio versutus]|nr:hypothetical protein B0684_05105 [Thioalkalivibrio versutus]
MTAVQSFCTREPQRRAHAKEAEPLRGWHPRFPDPALRPESVKNGPVEPPPAARRALARKTWGTNARVYINQCFLRPTEPRSLGAGRETVKRAGAVLIPIPAMRR